MVQDRNYTLLDTLYATPLMGLYFCSLFCRQLSIWEDVCMRDHVRTSTIQSCFYRQQSTNHHFNIASVRVIYMIRIAALISPLKRMWTKASITAAANIINLWWQSWAITRTPVKIWVCQNHEGARAVMACDIQKLQSVNNLVPLSTMATLNTPEWAQKYVKSTIKTYLD